MLARITVLLLSAVAGPAVGQTPPSPTPIASSAPVFPPGSEVLSLQGEPLGVLSRVETRPGGERILHIRRADGSMTTAPATVAFRGERAVVLDWTLSEFESGVAEAKARAVTEAAATPAGTAGSVPPRT